MLWFTIVDFAGHRAFAERQRLNVIHPLAKPTFRIDQLPRWRRSMLMALRVTVSYGPVAEQVLQGPTIVTCNHLSMLDGIVVALASPRPLVFPVTPRYARDDPFTSRVLQWFERRDLGRVVLMDKSHVFALRQLGRALARGESVCIFPEGRIGSGAALSENPGFHWLHTRTGCPVVRASITGADRSWLFAPAGKQALPPIHLAL